MDPSGTPRDGAILELRVKLASPSPHDKHSIMAYLLHADSSIILQVVPDRRTVLTLNAVQLSALLLRHAAARQEPSSHGTLYILCTFLGVAGGTPTKQQG